MTTPTIETLKAELAGMAQEEMRLWRDVMSAKDKLRIANDRWYPLRTRAEALRTTIATLEGAESLSHNQPTQT